MKPKIYRVITLIASALFFLTSQAQFGTTASAIRLTNCTGSNYYNTTGAGPAAIGSDNFNNTNLGVYTQNSGSLVLRGGEVRTFKNPALSNVCNVRMFYRVYLQSGTGGSFTSISLPFVNDCDVPTAQFPSGGSCVAGDQKWNLTTSSINLTAFAAGDYVLEVYYEVDGSSVSTSLCNETISVNNGGSNYKAYFSIQAPVLGSSNPTSCNGTEGSITISGLVPGVVYSVIYTDDGVVVGPANFTANPSGQVVISGLNYGSYYDISITANGCTKDFNTELTLSNFLITPTFPPIPAICQGSVPPTLPTTSNNGITGTWSPAVIDNQASGSYTFTPSAGSCGKVISRNITITPKVTPAFSFGTALTVCSGGAVPALPGTSTNGITGTWSPATVSNTASDVYTFTPSAGQCAFTATFTVTVNPNVTPVFSFGSSLTICSGGTVPALPTTSSNGVAGTWNPATVSNTASDVYTFTPAAGACAFTTTFTVTVNPNATPVFSFGTSLTICNGDAVPALPNTSNNGVTGTWSPATVSNTASGSYTFTPTAGLCALAATFNVTVNQKVTPVFSFGTSLTICSGGTVPALPGTSTNGITGTWSPATVSNTASNVYTFTPSAGECAIPTTFSVTVNPNVTPTFSFGTSLTICSGGTVPALPGTSTNGITGVWSPATVSNTASASYTFTPTAGLCATTQVFTVTVNPNVTPVFSFGTSLTICNGDAVPALPNTSTNGITGTWSPATVSNTTTGTYTFTPTAGLCATSATFNVTVNQKQTPAFTFGTSLTICSGGTVPALPGTSTNGINGTWSPATVSNTATAVYTFTPSAGECAIAATFSVTVNPNITPAFSFGSSLTICSGGTVPSLPATSANGITGSWSPATVSNTSSGTYTFSPSAGQCALTTNFTVTVNPNVTPTFSFGTSLTICEGATVPSLTTTSSNGITGTWSPATVSNTASATYTFTPSAGQCASTTTFSVTVNASTIPVFSFGNSLTICSGGSVPALPATSANGITGSWSPATVSNTSSGSYSFTPSAGICATTEVFSVTVNSNVTPTFGFGTSLTICEGGSVPSLPTTSSNGITGTWSPATVSNTASATYTFTPSAGQCAVTTNFSVTVNANTIPVFSFGNSLTICSGSPVPALPTTSVNGITGTWNPATVSNTTSASYTFTPSAGICATTEVFSVTVNPNLTPTFSFGTSQTICEGASVPSLPGTSINGVTGSWSPATVSNTTSATYTFTPSAGQCALNASFAVTVNPVVTPAFSFGTSLTICTNGTVPALPGTSTNGVTGTWSPSTVSNTATGTYTFTPSAGQCAVPVTFDVTVNAYANPTFPFPSSLTICAGEPLPALPTTSNNGVTGSWSPSSMNNMSSGVYVFTPTSGQCAMTSAISVTVNPIVTPSFSFGTSLTVCRGRSAPALPATSSNGITGSWSPSSIDNNSSASYTFTPDAGQCAVSTTLNVTVNSIVDPTFSFGTSLAICAGNSVPALPSNSSNGINGSWSPATVSNTASGTYTFTPSAGECANPATFTVTVTANAIPTFSFGTSLTICSGGTVPALPSVSSNGYNGSWTPATVSNTNSAVYTFTPQPVAGQCISPVTFTVTVNPVVTPTFGFAMTQTICQGATAQVLPATSTNGITGTWSPSVVSNLTSGTYTFTTSSGQCADPTATLTVTVNPIPSATARPDTTVTEGSVIPGFNPSVTPSGVNISWSNSNQGIGLPPSGIGSVPSFVATNPGSAPTSGVITLTPVLNGCSGLPAQYIINVLPLIKSVYVPNVFSPNNDGKNDVFYVYGNYISKIELRIFNQWGQEVEQITDKSKGWDGKFRGRPQPVGVYVYTLKVVLTDGKAINMKGNISLLR